jgi:aldose 1-epimerase
MPVDRTAFGRYDGQPVFIYTLRNAHGLIARVTNYGARLTEMHVPDRNGTMADVVLGFDDLADYIATDTYCGATCGRYCNRIKNGEFWLDGRQFQLTRNEQQNHLHGGTHGFDKQVWSAELLEKDNTVNFSWVSGRNAEGYPGELSVTSQYRLTDDNRLLISMSGRTDAPTILNMVHHSYWNLAGHAAGDVLQHKLSIEADFYTPMDAQLIPSGEILAVADTPFDFRTEKSIAQDIHAVIASLGYDHNFVLRGDASHVRPVAVAYDPSSGRGLSLKATEPGLQLYTAGYLKTGMIGKGGQPYRAHAGFTLETQKFPNSPNLSHFSSSRLDPLDVYEHKMELRFYTR